MNILDVIGEAEMPKMLPVEGQIARLRDVQEMVARRWKIGDYHKHDLAKSKTDDVWPHPYKFGDLLVPRLGGPYRFGKEADKLVMVVVDLIHDAERQWGKTGVDEGARLDTRVAYVVGDRVNLLWLESWGLMPFKEALS